MGCDACKGSGIIPKVITLSNGEQELEQTECECVADDFLAAHAINEMWEEE